VILQPHPLSPERARILPLNDIDVTGQVVAVAVRLDTFAARTNIPAEKGDIEEFRHDSPEKS
jgi:hypothetical protein